MTISPEPRAIPRRDAECSMCLMFQSLLFPVHYDSICGQLIQWECDTCRMDYDRVDTKYAARIEGRHNRPHAILALSVAGGDAP